jgi:two-component system sensor histidine kinase KdpD
VALVRRRGAEYNSGDVRRDPRFAERYGYLVAVVCVALATAVFYPGREHFAKGQWALLYLLIVGLVAGVSGARPALAAAVLSFFAWNYFLLPPYGTLRVADPRDWLSLFVYLIVAVAIGIQTGRLREREEEALARERETALLNRFSARLVSDAAIPEVARTLIDEVSKITQAECVALFLPDEAGELREFAAWPGAICRRDPEVPRLVAWANRQAKAVGLPAHRGAPGESHEWPISVSHVQAGAAEARHDLVLPLQTSTRQSGVLYIGPRADGRPYTYAEVRPVVALANQTSVFLERKHLQSVAVQADALREADRMKSTLVSAVSHELKTPLASLTATITGLLEGDLAWDEEQVRRELAAVAQDLVRLGGSISSLVDLSRLEASEWRPHLDRYEFGEILGTALSKLPPGQRNRVGVSVPEELPVIRVDFDQWVRVLEHLLGNALVYSGPDSPVRVGAEATAREVRMWVEDEGPGLSPEERQRVFDKFYRGKLAAAAPGTGIGLAITSEIVRFHGGRIWVEDVTPHGARFVVALPREESDGRA